jgi:hypothetical protein
MGLPNNPEASLIGGENISGVVMWVVNGTALPSPAQYDELLNVPGKSLCN